MEEEDTNKNKNDEISMRLLVAGKRAGLSLEEMNEFRVKDLFAFIETYAEQVTGKEQPTNRMANQNDIDQFYSMM